MALSPRREFFAKLALLGGFAALGSATRPKAQIAGSVTLEDITCDNAMPAVLAYPAGGGSFPTVVLMHERYGLVQHTRDQAMRCARDARNSRAWSACRSICSTASRTSFPAARRPASASRAPLRCIQSS